MGSQSPETRCKVFMRYKELHGKDLASLMKSETGKKPFGQALQFLAVDPVRAECMMIDKACKGIGTNELMLFTILCGRSNKEMELLKKRYFDMHSKDLGRVVDSEIGGDFEKLIVNVMQAVQEEYDPDFHTDEKMAKDVEELHDHGIGRWGTNEKGLFKILCASPPEYLKRLNMAYAEKYGYTLSKALEKELKGDTEEAALFTLGMKIQPYETMAGLIKKACKGFGTNELLLTACLIRFQSVLKEVETAHVEMYSKTIADRVKEETRGDYEKVLLEVVKAGMSG